VLHDEVPRASTGIEEMKTIEVERHRASAGVLHDEIPSSSTCNTRMHFIMQLCIASRGKKKKKKGSYQGDEMRP
jgi:hypothetical protein